MNQNISSAREIIERLVKQSGITKKLAGEILHAIPAIIEEGLKKDGEVRVKGMGTFRLKWTKGRLGRNPKTGERVEIPSHNRVVFLPEQAFKEYINRDNRLLGYKIIPSAETASPIEETSPVPEPEGEPFLKQIAPEPESDLHYTPELKPIPAPEPEPEPEPSSRKRKIHWIVPAAIAVIIILSLVFYFRNFHTSRQSEVVSQQSAVSSQQSAVSSQQSAVSSQQSAVSSQQSAVSSQSSESIQQAVEPIPKSELSTPNSELSTKNSELIPVPEGTHLFKLAREIYGNPYLWVLIYKENQDKISDPDMVVSGRELLIPVLEGKPDRLTRDDSLAVSEGYRLVYEFYKAQDESRAKDCSRSMKRYKPK